MAVLKELRYLTAHDVSTRIGNSIIRYRGRPVYCQLHREDKEDLTVDLFSPTDGSRFNGIHSSDDEIDVKAFPIGYVNKELIASYTTRIPSRRPMQGLSINNTIYWHPSKDGGRRQQPLNRGDLTTKYFFDMLNDKYPSLDKCLAFLKDAPSGARGHVSSAFNRKFAVTEDDVGQIKLNYFALPIAIFNSKKQEFVLSERLAHYEPLLKMFDIPITVG